MDNKDTLTIHLSDNGKMPLINDVENYEGSWNPHLILFGNCLQVSKGILEGAYKNVDIKIHIEEADEVAYTDTTIITGIHLNDINYICSSSGKILTTIEYKGQMIDFICDSIIRMKDYSLYFRDPLLTEYELLWSKEQKLRFERENEVYKFFTSKSISLDLHNQYLGSFLPFDSVKILQIEPYIEEDTSEDATGFIDKITLIVSKLHKNIYCIEKGWRATYEADKYFNSISSLQHFLKDLKSREEYELSLINDNVKQTQYLLKGKNGKGISLDELRNLGVNLKVTKDDENDDKYDDGIDWRRESWYAMTDGQYGDMPDGFDGDYDDLVL
jgi:hypothetical protein